MWFYEGVLKQYYKQNHFKATIIYWESVSFLNNIVSMLAPYNWKNFVDVKQFLHFQLSLAINFVRIIIKHIILSGKHYQPLKIHF